MILWIAITILLKALLTAFNIAVVAAVVMFVLVATPLAFILIAVVIGSGRR